MALLEICCYSLDCALRAAQAGADRIELCASVKEGGITPSYATLVLASEQLALPVQPIVRPRGGDFCYSQPEFASMLRDIAWLRERGFKGVVTGVLSADGTVDSQRMRQLMQAAGNMAVTFHRAFDMCRDAMLALQQLTDMGVARILTSGQQQSAVQGLELLVQLTRRSTGPLIMAGAGVRAENISQFLAAGIKELHSSAGRWLPSAMEYRRADVSMSADQHADEYACYQVDTAAVAAMKALIRADGK